MKNNSWNNQNVKQQQHNNNIKTYKNHIKISFDQEVFYFMNCIVYLPLPDIYNKYSCSEITAQPFS